MSDGIKSVLVAVFILFVFVVVLGGEFRHRSVFGVPIGGAPRISFCESMGDTPVLGALPCFLLNLVVMLAVIVPLFLAIGLARKLLR